jgi:hypothetical protein
MIKTRYVAALIYFAFKGPNWLQQFNFLSADNMCMWNQIDTDDRAYGIECGGCPGKCRDVAIA